MLTPSKLLRRAPASSHSREKKPKARQLGRLVLPMLWQSMADGRKCASARARPACSALAREIAADGVPGGARRHQGGAGRCSPPPSMMSIEAMEQGALQSSACGNPLWQHPHLICDVAYRASGMCPARRATGEVRLAPPVGVAPALALISGHRGHAPSRQAPNPPLPPPACIVASAPACSACPARAASAHVHAQLPPLVCESACV